MCILDDLFSIYKSSKIKITSPKKIVKKQLQFGDVIEVYFNFQLNLADQA